MPHVVAQESSSAAAAGGESDGGSECTPPPSPLPQPALAELPWSSACVYLGCSKTKSVSKMLLESVAAETTGEAALELYRRYLQRSLNLNMSHSRLSQLDVDLLAKFYVSDCPSAEPKYFQILSCDSDLARLEEMLRIRVEILAPYHRNKFPLFVEVHNRRVYDLIDPGREGGREIVRPGLRFVLVRQAKFWHFYRVPDRGCGRVRPDPLRYLSRMRCVEATSFPPAYLAAGGGADEPAPCPYQRMVGLIVDGPSAEPHRHAAGVCDSWMNALCQSRSLLSDCGGRSFLVCSLISTNPIAGQTSRHRKRRRRMARAARDQNGFDDGNGGSGGEETDTSAEESDNGGFASVRRRRVRARDAVGGRFPRTRTSLSSWPWSENSRRLPAAREPSPSPPTGYWSD